MTTNPKHLTTNNLSHLISEVIEAELSTNNNIANGEIIFHDLYTAVGALRNVRDEMIKQGLDTTIVEECLEKTGKVLKALSLSAM